MENKNQNTNNENPQNQNPNTENNKKPAKKKGPAKKSVLVLKPLWGKFNLPYPVDKIAKIESKLADELIKAGYAMSEAEAKKIEAAKEKDQTQDSED